MKSSEAMETCIMVDKELFEKLKAENEAMNKFINSLPDVIYKETDKWGVLEKIEIIQLKENYEPETLEM